MIPTFTAYPVWLGWVWATSFLAGVMEFLNPFLLKGLTDAALDQQTETFQGLVLLALAATLVDIALKYFFRIAVSRYEILTVRDLRDRIAAHLQRLPLSTLERYHTGDLVSRTNNDIDRIAALTRRVNELVQQPLIFILGFSYLLFLSWKLLLATCILIPLSALIFDKVVRPMQAHSRKELEGLARANAVTQDAIRGIYIIKAFNLQQLLTGKFRRIAEDVRHEGLALDRRRALEFAVFLMLRYIPQLVAPLYGGYLAFQGEISVGSLLASTYLIWMVFIPVETMLSWMRGLREAAPAVERVYELLDQPVERVPDRKIGPPQDSHALSFSAVDFEYTPGQPILAGFSLALDPGQTAALVGPSGCGKSTVLKLLCGFYQPQRGEIRVGGQEIFQAGIQEARKQISLVSQETYLFPTTLAENIAYGRPGASEEEIIQAARAANADDFISALPDGYQTQVGEWGSRLSGGERQRIGLARAILKDAPILLLDEPTSALDAQSEALVQDALERLMVGRTALVVAHRLSTIRNADRIIVLDQGRIVEEGKHQELMASDTLYRRLVLKQTALEANRG